VEAVQADEEVPGVHGGSRCTPDATDRAPEHESAAAADGAQVWSTVSDDPTGGRRGWTALEDGREDSRMATWRAPAARARNAYRAGCSSLNRLPAFVPTREFLPTIAR
jgi:hypothetical protein